jgi:ribose transport system substrate-binding protein
MAAKNLVAAVCGVALLAGVAACGGDDSGAASGGGGGGKSRYKVTLITGVKGDAFYGSLGCGAEQAAKRLGVDLEIQGPDAFSPDKQTPVLNAVVASKPDAIMIAPTDAKAMYAPLKQAAAQGIKIVLVDTTLEDPSLAESQVTSDNQAAGRIAAQEIAREVGGKGSVLTVDVNPGITTTDARVHGFQAGATAAGLQDLGVQYTGDDPAKASSIVTSTLAKHPDLAGVFATNTLTGEGAATGLRQSRKTGQVKLVGFDANPSGVQALEDGNAQAQVVLKPLDIGTQGLEQAVAALEGKPTKEKILTGSLVATKKNLNDPQVQKYLYQDSCQ